METPDYDKLLTEMIAEHRVFQDQVIRLMERQADLEGITERLEARDKEREERDKVLERLVQDVAENNIRISHILVAHDDSIEELDARLKRIEERRRGPAPN